MRSTLKKKFIKDLQLKSDSERTQASYPVRELLDKNGEGAREGAGAGTMGPYYHREHQKALKRTPFNASAEHPLHEPGNGRDARPTITTIPTIVRPGLSIHEFLPQNRLKKKNQDRKPSEKRFNRNRLPTRRKLIDRSFGNNPA